MKYRLRVIRSAKPGALPRHFLIVDAAGIPVDKYLYETDARKRLRELNKQKKRLV